MTRTASPPLLLRFHRWPAPHRRLWEAGLDPDNLDDDDPPYGTTLAPSTVCNARKGWSRFLATVAPEVRETASLAELVHPASIRHFFATLEAAGNCRATIASRLWEVRQALRIMKVEADVRWLTSPGGVAVRTLVHDLVKRRQLSVYHSRQLFALGQQLMDAALALPDPRRRALALRDGLLVALLASRAPRLRTISAVRVGRQLVRTGDGGGYRLEFEPADTKRKQRLEYDLPAGLTPLITRYLTTERPVLLNGQTHDGFWVGQHGRALHMDGITAVLRRLSGRHDLALNAHAFRYAIGTTAPMVDPQHPGIASAILGNSAAVAAKCYDLSRQVDAAQQFQAALDEEWRESEAIARRAFQRLA